MMTGTCPLFLLFSNRNPLLRRRPTPQSPPRARATVSPRACRSGVPQSAVRELRRHPGGGEQTPLLGKKRAWALPKVQRERRKEPGRGWRRQAGTEQRGEDRRALRGRSWEPGEVCLCPRGARLYRRRGPGPASAPCARPSLPRPSWLWGHTPRPRPPPRNSPRSRLRAWLCSAARGRRPPEPPPVAQTLVGARREGPAAPRRPFDSAVPSLARKAGASACARGMFVSCACACARSCVCEWTSVCPCATERLRVAPPARHRATRCHPFWATPALFPGLSSRAR